MPADRYMEGYREGLRMAREAYEAHDKAGREWVPGSLYDTLNREAAARVCTLEAEAQAVGGDRDDG